MPRDAVVAGFEIGRLVGDTLVGIGADRGDPVGDGRLVRIVAGKDVPPETVSLRSGQIILKRSSFGRSLVVLKTADRSKNVRSTTSSPDFLCVVAQITGSPRNHALRAAVSSCSPSPQRRWGAELHFGCSSAQAADPATKIDSTAGNQHRSRYVQKRLFTSGPRTGCNKSVNPGGHIWPRRQGEACSPLPTPIFISSCQEVSN